MSLSSPTLLKEKHDHELSSSRSLSDKYDKGRFRSTFEVVSEEDTASSSEESNLEEVREKDAFPITITRRKRRKSTRNISSNRGPIFSSDRPIVGRTRSSTTETESLTMLSNNQKKCGESPTKIRRVSSSHHQHTVGATAIKCVQNEIVHSKNNYSPTLNYDHPSTTQINTTTIARGGVACPFPWKLHDMLEYCTSSESLLEESITHSQSKIVTWNEAGTAFAVLNTKVFVQTILPRFFAQTKYASFQRQLNLYGFTRVAIPSTCSKVSSSSVGTHTKNYSYYSHPYFIRGQRDIVRYMVRCKIKGTGKKRVIDDGEDIYQFGQYIGQIPTTTSSDDEEDNVDDREIYESCIECKSDPNASNHITGNDNLIPFVNVRERITNTEANTNTEAKSIQDGELLFFEGSPFHFLNIHQVNNDAVLPLREATVSPMMMLPPSMKLGLDENKSDEYTNDAEIRGLEFHPMYQKGAFLDVEHIDCFASIDEISKDVNCASDRYIIQFPLLQSSSSNAKLKPSSRMHITHPSTSRYDKSPCNNSSGITAI